MIDGKMQSAEVDEFIYHECLIHPALLSHPKSVYHLLSPKLLINITFPSYLLIFNYYVYIFILLLCRPKNVFIMGGGEGSAAREALKHKLLHKVVMCDIDRVINQLLY